MPLFDFERKNECVVGFMYKTTLEKYVSWDANRQRNFLIKRVDRPLSVDSGVWEDQEKLHLDFQTRDIELHPDLVIDESFETLLITMMNADYDAFSEHLTQSNLYLPDYISWPFETIDEQFLGYDIADFMMVSGLSNCAYSKTDLEQLSGLRPYINNHGLIDTMDKARSIKELTEKRVNEHSPFYVMGLYRITYQSINDRDI